jgi:mono/diheme cytochrome c family protein
MTVASSINSNRLQRTLIMTPDIKRILVPLDFSANSTRAHAKKLAFAGAAMIALLLTPVGAAAQETMKQTTPGGEVFRTYCASCHGSAARGDGPLSSSMRKKPANLTEIAKRNGGEFPTDMVFRTIDGRQPIRGHGGPDMPVWGDAFGKSREAGDADRVKAVIQSLVDYLEAIQLRATHDQQH